MVISALVVSANEVRPPVARWARKIRMMTGTTVQTTSSLVLCDHFSATAPRDLRKRNMATNMAPKTTMPMTTQTHRATMCMA